MYVCVLGFDSASSNYWKTMQTFATHFHSNEVPYMILMIESDTAIQIETFPATIEIEIYTN